MTIEGNGSNQIDLQFQTLIFRPFLKIGLIFANLKALGDLLKHIERLQISVTSLARTLALSQKIFQEACQCQHFFC